MLTEEQRENFRETVDIKCFYDNWLSQDQFEEEIIRPEGNEDLYRLNPDYGWSKPYVSLSENINYKKLLYKSFKDICEICNKVNGDYSFGSDLFDFNCDPLGYVQEFFEGADYTEDNISALKEFLLVPVEIFSTHGYSQGDYQEYIVFGEEEIKQDGLEKYIDHLFWDAPIHCSITIGQQEYFVENCDVYDYDKEKYVDDIINQVKADIIDVETLREYLLEQLPDCPEYVY